MFRNLFFNALFPGLGEEPLYRALVLIPAAAFWNKKIGYGKFSLPIAALLCGLIFSAGHIAFTFIPFKLYHLIICS